MVKAGATTRVKRKRNNDNGSGKTLAMLLLFSFSGLLLNAQDATATTATVPAPEPAFDYWGLGALMFFSMLMVIGFELIIIIVLYRTGMRLLRTEEQRRKAEQRDMMTSMMESKIMRSITDVPSVEEEQAILMDHEYDGIRELDNNLPGWWKYGFYLTIVVGVIYLINYHVLETGLSSEQEYQKELETADREIAEYKRTAANSVDETTVTLLTDPASLSAGRAVYMEKCTQCHGASAEGKIGPNLTDAYWLHKGGVADVFKSVKYGWPDKGMKSWQAEIGPLPMQQLVSYVLSLQESNPADAKDKEGELYVPEGGALASDSVPISDSVGGIDSMPVKDTIRK
jgi:cytochrome c oxidase cbb3-type subunit 3